MTDVQYYNISDFENIKWNDSENKCTLPDEAMKLINLLTDQVSSPTYNKTPTFSNNDKNKFKKKKRDVESVKPEDWELIRNFQETKIVKKEGIDKEVDNIRSLINKLTDKTYDKIFEKITESLDNISNCEEYNEETQNKIGYAIFNMATSNKFNSNVYSRFCSELKLKYDFITNIINSNISEFMKLFENMEFVSPDDDYDKFCEMNITNEKRRAMSLFLTNLYKNEVVSLDILLSNITNLQNMIVNEATLDDKSKQMELEELSENLYIMLTNIDKSVLKASDKWLQIYNNIIKIKTIDTKTHPGVSHKCKFKHMDIYDKTE